MKHLALYIEEIHLGFIHNPHTDRHEKLTEKVTVCPSCFSLRSLRHENGTVTCIECRWDSTKLDLPRVA